MNMNDFSGKRVTVMGLGLHGGGASVASWLAKHGAKVLVTDLKTKKELQSSIKQLYSSSESASWRRSREARKKNFSTPQPKLRIGTGQAGSKNIAFVLGRHRKQDFIDTDMVVRNPAVPIESPFLKIAEKHGVPIENEATLFFKHCRSKNIIGVTGTRGKSTTSAMIHAILKVKCQMSNVKCRAWLAGNIRTTPMLSIVDRVAPSDWVVLELSSWHLEDMDRQKISPHVAVVTNLLQDHLNRYSGMREYARAKEGIVRHQTKRDIAVLNKENTWTQAMAKKTKAKIYWFPSNHFHHNSLQLPLTLRGRDRSIPPLNIRGGEGALWRVGGVFGEHNMLNADAAATASAAIGIPFRIIRSALRTFRGLPDRLEFIRMVRGVRYYNDTTATTPDATIAALQALSCNVKRVTCNIILIAGGSDKKLDYKFLIPWIEKTCKAVVLLPGTATEKMKKLFHYPITKLPNYQITQLFITEAPTMLSAVRTASRLAHAGDIVLLSPAATSFGLFQHEFDRGEQFRRAVRRLVKSQKS